MICKRIWSRRWPDLDAKAGRGYAAWQSQGRESVTGDHASERVKIFQIGHPVIRAKAAPVSLPLAEEAKQLIATMTAAMRQAGLVGIAAPQIGASKRIFLSEIRAGNSRNVKEDGLRIFLNPEILDYSADKEVDYEGCGSVADSNLFGEVERSQSVTVRYSDEMGQQKTETFEGLLARIVQHEFDHLEGVVFTDKLYRTTTLMSGSTYRDMRAEQQAATASVVPGRSMS